MSEIPYFFHALPEEFLTNEFLEDAHMMKLIRYIMRRIKYEDHEEILHVNRQHKKVKLYAFEWVYGRERCAIECDSTPDIIRARITQLLALQFIEFIPSSSTSTYSVYRLVKTSFRKNTTQQFPQQIPPQVPQQFPHKQEQENKDVVSCLKETRKKNLVVPLSLLDQKKEKQEVSQDQIEALFVYLESIGQEIPKVVVKRWLKNYGEEKLIANIGLVIKQNTFKDFGASVEDACKGDYARIARNVEINRDFALTFKNSNKIVSLKLTKKYCVDNNNVDYQYSLEPQQFKEILERKFK
jgi:hypothetical protein